MSWFYVEIKECKELWSAACADVQKFGDALDAFSGTDYESLISGFEKKENKTLKVK